MGEISGLLKSDQIGIEMGMRLLLITFRNRLNQTKLGLKYGYFSHTGRSWSSLNQTKLGLKFRYELIKSYTLKSLNQTKLGLKW